MAQTDLFSQQSIAYFFFKSKDVHVENGLSSITLFVRLAREITCFTGRKKQTDIETLWVQVKDIGIEQASEKVKELPNCIEKYEVSEIVFHHLLQLAQSYPDELYSMVPYYVKATREIFIPWQELEQSWKDR